MKSLRYIFTGLAAIVVVWLLVYLFSNPETIPPFLNAALMMGIPLLVGIWFARKLGVGWGVYGLGALTFVASQVLHIPFNNYVLNPWLARIGVEATSTGSLLVLAGAAGGLSAGLFEETARYIIYRRWMKTTRTWKNAVMLGAGHGGIEAMLSGALVMYIFLQMIVLKNASPQAFLELVGADRAESIRLYMEAYWSAPWYASLLGAVERSAAIILQISLSVIMLQVFTRNNRAWYWAAVLWHAFINFAALLAIQAWGVYWTEVLLWGFALVGVAIIFALRQDEPPAEEPEELPPLPALDAAVKQPLTIEQIEKSRYD